MRKNFFIKNLILKGCIAVLVTGLISSCCLFPRRIKGERVTVPMLVTAYCSCKKCCGWKRTIWNCCLFPVYSSGPYKGKRKKVGITADGTKAKKGVIAADISKYPYGTEMYVPGYGWGVVHDRGKAIKGNHIDVFFDSHKKALEWGRKKLNVTILK
jgi:3D (Asp-Asp-Asp) domain-containing protein